MDDVGRFCVERATAEAVMSGVWVVLSLRWQLENRPGTLMNTPITWH